MESSEHGSPNDAEFVQLLTEHQNMIRCFVYSLLPSDADADDILQKTNIVLWEKRSGFKMGTSFRSWAFTVARLQTMSHLQNARRKGWLVFEPDVAELIASDFQEVAPEKSVFDRELRALEGCLKELGADHLELLAHRYWKSAPIRDLAAKRKCSEGSLKAKIFRLRGALRRCIQERLASANPQPDGAR